MKIESLKCPNCNSTLNVVDGQTSVACEYCGTELAIDDESIDININMTNQEEAGYQFEKGRQRAQAEQENQQEEKQFIITSVETKPKKRRTWLWVLGWLCIFPLPLTIIMLNADYVKKIDIKIRAGIVIAAWIIYFIIYAISAMNKTSG